LFDPDLEAQVDLHDRADDHGQRTASTPSACRRTALADLSERTDCAKGVSLTTNAKSLRLHEVNAALENPDIWNDPKRAQELGKEKRTLEDVVGTIDHLTSNLADNTELYEMSRRKATDGLQPSRPKRPSWRATVEQLEFRRMFNNPADPSNCFIDIQAGAGGTEACDWANMLLRQYLKYCERKGFTPRWRTRPRATPPASRAPPSRWRASTPSACCAPRPACTAWCARARSTPPAGGTPRSRPVRLPGGRRLDRDRDQPLRRAHRHLPRQRRRRPAHQQDRLGGAPDAHPHRHRGAVPGRPQPAQQPGRGLEALRSRLYDFEMRKRMEEQQKLEDTKTDVGWGHQIRSYVLDQSRIKDLRTNVEVSATQKVLDGDLDAFIEASLKQGV
jgi:peptide chain release factor 2